jgi:hypothetical protein
LEKTLARRSWAEPDGGKPKERWLISLKIIVREPNFGGQLQLIQLSNDKIVIC